MKTAWKKSLRDLTRYPKKTLLVIFALSLGIWGVGTVVVSDVILTNDLNQNFQNTFPSNVTFNSEDFGSLKLEEFVKKPEVEAAEFRDFSLHRIEVKPNVWIPLWLFGVEDFNRPSLAKVFYEKGNKIPSKGSILIERDGLKVSDIDMGTSPRIRVGDSVFSVKVTGICFDPAQAPATQDAFMYAYTDKETYASITQQPINHRLIVRLKNMQSKAEVEQVSRKLVEEMQKSGIHITSIDIPKFNEHPHQWQLNTLLFLIGTIGLLAFIMGAVLVSQLMRSILTSQIRQIGILKSIGATSAQIFQMYLFMLMTIGVLSGMIAIPLAVKTGTAFSGFVAGKLNFDILTQTVPFRVYLYLIIASITLPAILSFSMLLKGTSVSIKNALSDYGITQSMITYQFSILKRLNISFILQLAFRNSLRNTKRLAVTILAMAFGVAIFSTGFNVRESLWQLLSGLKDEMRYDVQVVLNRPVSKEEALKSFKNLDNVKIVETWIGGRGEIQSKVISTENGAGIVALPRDSKLLKLQIKEGRWLLTSNNVEIVMNQQSRILFQNPAIGSTIDITIGNKIIHATLVGLTEQFEKPKIYMDLGQYDSILNPDHLVNTLTFVAKNNNYNEVIRLKTDIENVIVNSNLKVLIVMSQAERVKIIYDHLDIILSTVILLSFLVLVVSSVGMASATSINIWERTREIGVMRSIGATPKMIYNLFVFEGLITSIISILSGLLLAYPLSQLASVFFGNLMLGEGANLQYAFSVNGFFITIIVTQIFAFFASRLPAKSAIRIPTHKALSYE